MAVGCYRKYTGREDFLAEAVEKAMVWMLYQSPADRVLVGQLPTSDWRDEQWVVGYGLFVNTIVIRAPHLRWARELDRQLYHRVHHGVSHDVHTNKKIRM